MKPLRPKLPGVLALVASATGFIFAAFSTYDYTQHLDRQLHGTHCSFIPGLTGVSTGANACTTAMYSPYSAIFRATFWGGIPISLFAMGTYAFFIAYALYIYLARDVASRRSWRVFGALSAVPLLASLIMFSIALVKLGVFCKLCVGLYLSSILLAVAGRYAWKFAPGRAMPWATHSAWSESEKRAASDESASPPWYIDPNADANLLPAGSVAVGPAMLAIFGFFTLFPAVVYASTLPDYSSYLGSCGTLTQPVDNRRALVHIPTATPKEHALFFVDPLCPSCKALHERLIDDGVFDKLDVTMAMFPLDDACNWMVERAVHPGACVVAKAFVCAAKVNRSREVIEWAYENQKMLHDAGMLGPDVIRKRVQVRFPDVDACIDSREARQQIDRMLQFAVANRVPVSTPQLFLGGRRICEEDTDLGLAYTLTKLAPQVMQ